jgi:hypothetical protein
MYRILNFYVIVFFKFIIYKINSEMMVLIEIEKTDITDADIGVD